MHAILPQAVSLGDQTFGPGVFECSPGEFHALAQRAPIRPATAIELETASVEAPAKPREVQTAARSRRAAAEPATA